MVSIIVPIYNSDSTLARCIDSILKQTFSNWELLLIDDGSKDYSASICKEYAMKDERIKVFHKENGGVSSARNVGLDNAKGEWITFVDSDDCVKPEYLENLFKHSNEGIDLVISYAEILGKEYIEKERYPSKIISSENFEVMFVENDMHWHTSPWSKLYKRSIIEQNNLRFCEGMHIGEDAVFLYSYLLESKLIYISSDTDYCYYSEIDNSLTKRVNSLKSEFLSYEKIEKVINEMIRERKIVSKIALDNLHWVIAVYSRRILNALYHNYVRREKRINTLKCVEWKLYIENIHSRTIKEKILIQLLKYKLYKIYDFIRIVSFKIKNI